MTRSRSTWKIEQSEAVGERGMIAAKHPLSAEVGAEILRAGGNAIDAAVATAFAESVVEPAMTGIGGGGNMVIAMATGETVAIEYGMKSPAAARPDMYELLPGHDTDGFGWRNTLDEANIWGHRSVAVPGTVAGLCLALREYGTMPLAEVVTPAIRIAREGFPVTFFEVMHIGLQAHRLRRFPATAEILLRPYQGDWKVPSLDPPDKIVQTDLARTLEQIARLGPDGFYRGEVADLIDQDMREHGGSLTASDLTAYRPRVSRPGFVGRYRGFEILTAPWGNGGITALQSLRILEGFDVRAMGHNSPEYLHVFIEAARRAFADRFVHVADPDVADVPWRGLMSDEYAASRRAEIDPARASASYEAGDPWPYQGSPSGRRVTTGVDPRSDHQTTHLCAMDGQGNAVSLTQTLMSTFGSRVVAAGTGVILNNGMMWFDPEPGHANSVAPHKRPLSNMVPLIAIHDGRAELVVGASGGRKIINCVTQLVLNVIDHQMGIQAAISAPRIDCSTRDTLIDDRLEAEVVERVRSLGHSAQLRTESFAPHLWASQVGILTGADGRRHGGVHRYYPAVAIGV
ncbi:MAG TPA: gamma-glutamyltransferase [Chloroflexota bacterium]|nr:gamma-glutamyltransferase [Chloroflexota bacterium]